MSASKIVMVVASRTSIVLGCSANDVHERMVSIQLKGVYERSVKAECMRGVYERSG
jgi:hypothetical protein